MISEENLFNKIMILYMYTVAGEVNLRRIKFLIVCVCSLLSRVILFIIYLYSPERRDLPSVHLH